MPRSYWNLAVNPDFVSRNASCSVIRKLGLHAFRKLSITTDCG